MHPDSYSLLSPRRECRRYQGILAVQTVELLRNRSTFKSVSSMPFLNKVRVSGLSRTACEADLRGAFSGLNVTTCQLIVTKANVSRGFGFVTFGSEIDTQTALSLDGTQFNGKILQVVKAQPRSERKQTQVQVPIISHRKITLDPVKKASKFAYKTKQKDGDG